MNDQRKYCFVAMPFTPELNFFYLYVKDYLEREYGIRVERGDARVLTKPLMEKIRDEILRADLVIAEVTDGNPNVLYEVGLAHASSKPVLFLTRKPPEQAPVDIRQFEFVEYELGNHVDFLSKLNNAISNAFGAAYAELYERACEFLRRTNAETGLQCQPQSLDIFQLLVKRGEQTGGVPAAKAEDLLAQFLLPKIILDFTDPRVIQRCGEWLQSLARR